MTMARVQQKLEQQIASARPTVKLNLMENQKVVSVEEQYLQDKIAMRNWVAGNPEAKLYGIPPKNSVAKKALTDALESAGTGGYQASVVVSTFDLAIDAYLDRAVGKVPHL